jgi:hypothetical protein
VIVADIWPTMLIGALAEIVTPAAIEPPRRTTKIRVPAEAIAFESEQKGMPADPAPAMVVPTHPVGLVGWTYTVSESVAQWPSSWNMHTPGPDVPVAPNFATHCASVVHATQVFVDRLQIGLVDLAQSESAVQPTQTPPSAQIPFPVGQS